MASRSSQNANSAVRTQPDGNGLVVARDGEAVAKAHRHPPPVDGELLEGEGQRQRHCLAPGTLEEDEGLLQRVCYCIKVPCPLRVLACLSLALPPLTCPRNAYRVDAEATLRHHHRLGLTGDQGEEPYGVVRYRGIAQSLSGARSHQRQVPPLWENP